MTYRIKFSTRDKHTAEPNVKIEVEVEANSVPDVKRLMEYALETINKA